MFVVKGAMYYNPEFDELVSPRYTGYFYVVDCDRWGPAHSIREEYAPDRWSHMLVDPKIYRGVEYFKYDPGPVETDGLILLSDLSGLKYTEDETVFD